MMSIYFSTLSSLPTRSGQNECSTASKKKKKLARSSFSVWDILIVSLRYPSRNNGQKRQKCSVFSNVNCIPVDSYSNTCQRTHVFRTFRRIFQHL